MKQDLRSIRRSLLALIERWLENHSYGAWKMRDLISLRLNKGQDLRVKHLFARNRFAILMVWETKDSAKKRENEKTQ